MENDGNSQPITDPTTLPLPLTPPQQPQQSVTNPPLSTTTPTQIQHGFPINLSMKPSSSSSSPRPYNTSNFIPSSPSSSTNSHRDRRRSISSNISATNSTTTDPSSVADESEDSSTEKDPPPPPSSAAAAAPLAFVPVASNIGVPISTINSSAAARQRPSSNLALTSTSSSSSSSTSSSSDFFSPSSSSSSQQPTPTPSLPISIAPATRLSTTPHFPSPLAQATSGIDDELEQAKGEDGDGESEDEDVDSLHRSSSGGGTGGGGGGNGGGEAGTWERQGSPLARATDASSALFGEMDMSPTLGIIGLPELNALGLDTPSNTISSASSASTAIRTPPRPSPRSGGGGGGHQRSLSGRDRDSSPEFVEGGSPSSSGGGRTARALRVRSVGRASGLALRTSIGGASSDEGSIAGTSPTLSAGGRMRSRTAGMESGSPILGGGGGGSGTFSGFATSSPFTYPASGGVGSPIGSRPTIAPLVTGGSPPGVLPTASTNSISRRASINLASPPRPFPPPSPSLPRTPRSSLSVALATPIPTPFPAPPPPIESIKLQKVPEVVRSALDFRPSVGLNFLADAAAAASGGSIPGSAYGLSSPEIKVPKTPAATRAPSPASHKSSSGSATSHPPSQSSSRVQSRAPSRRGSSENSPIVPLTSQNLRRGSAEHPSTSSSPPPPLPISALSTVAAHSNLDTPPPIFSTTSFSQPSPQQQHLASGLVVPESSSQPFPSSAPPLPSTRRDRAQSVYSPLSHPLLIPSVTSGSGPAHDLGVSPLSTGLVPFASGDALGVSPFLNPSSSAQGGGADLTARTTQTQGRSRLSSHRTSIAPADPSSLTSENTDEYAQIILASRSAKMRKWKTSTSSSSSMALDLSGLNKESFSRRPLPLFMGEDGGTVEEMDITEEGGEFGGSGGGGVSKEIEWVDWLDEYRKMKEAKLEAEQAQLSSKEEKEEKKEALLSAAEPPSLVKGKGKATTQADGEYNPFEATTADLISRRTTGFLTPDPPVQYFPLATPSLGIKTTSTPISPPADHRSHDDHGLGLSITHTRSSTNNASPGAKRRKQFKLGTKIDAWWSAVRTSFSVGSEPDRGDRNRRTSDSTTTGFPASTDFATSRTSSQFTRPQSFQPTGLTTPSLRNAASAQDLAHSRDNSPDPKRLSSQKVPAGALAPARMGPSLKPPKPAGVSSGSDSDTGTTKAADSRWRNPHLSLNLGPAFSTMAAPPADRSIGPLAVKRPTFTQQSSAESSSSPSEPASSLFSHPQTRHHPPPPTRQTKLKEQALASGIPISSPGLTPGHAPMWDRTPGLVPVSTTDAIRGTSLATATQPEVIREAKKSGFSMHTVRQQIRLRLANAKENCDKELKKIVQGITAHVELELHKQLQLPLGGFDDGRFGDLVDAEGSSESVFPLADPDSESEALADTDAEYDTGYTDSDGGARPSPRPRGLSSPRLPPRRPSVRRQSSVSMSTRLQRDHPRRQSLAPHMRTLASANSSIGERRSLPGSASSSRSTSRSRSPLPPKISTGSRSPAHSSQSLQGVGSGDIAESALIVLLQEIITVATEILDTPISKLTSRSGTCAEYIQRVQQIGKAWEENPDLPLRGWYVQLLLAVAGLSRVVEWWEAERGFWTFDDADDEDAEPILFVAKPTTDDSLELPRASGGSYPPLEHSATKFSSPLGIDLGVSNQDAVPSDFPVEMSPTAHQEATKRDAEDLRQAVEQVRSQTLLMELTLDGQLFQYLSSAWSDLVGMDPAECIEIPIADFLFPDDAAVFAEATRQLEADDSHTVEVSFRLRVGAASSSSQDENSPDDLYDIMEGKGMLMIDGLTGGPSHTMWVVRPAPYSPNEPSSGALPTLQRRLASDRNISFSPIPRLLPTEPVLCRICERPTPAWFFEKHNETCNETHRLESDISECNDRLRELIQTVDTLAASLDIVEPVEGPEYRGIPLIAPPPVPTPPTYLEALRPPLATKPQSMQIRKNQRRVIEQVLDIVRTALDISTPSVTDETGDIPIQDQRLLSPNSENKLALVMRWQRPVAEEAALIRLIADTEEQTRFKLNSVNRLRNTILYAEKVRQEWEAKAMALTIEHRGAGGTLFDSPQLQPLQFNDSSHSLEHLDISQPPAPAGPRPSIIKRETNSPRLSPDGPTMGSPNLAALALSPRIPSGVPSSRTKASSIKDFTILKPISKGAFGSVYLARKITTGDYYAIKVLKKSDMIAKNQVTNVKAERMILMTQTESDFVVKLFYTFQSRDYLYLVMEYLNGGDCAALIKNMGELPEEWARKYIAEVVVGLEYLHASGIVHRDLKPDNLLIDTYGHLKLTDFGLSRIGLLGRQTRMPASRDQQRRGTDSSSRSPSKEHGPSNNSSPSSTPGNALGASQASYFGSLGADNFWLDTPASESSGSGSLGLSTKAPGTPSKPTITQVSQVSNVLNPLEGGLIPQKHFVGTPDYLAPESILGLGMDARVDWWALGVICYEFLYGFPPFHDETPEKVFENILSRRIEWHEGEIDISPDAHDFMNRLLCSETDRRLGAEGAAQVKNHPWLAGIDWANLLNGEVDFIPKISDPESTDYFDPRGATAQGFDDDDLPHDSLTAIPPSPEPSLTRSSDPKRARNPRERSETEPSPHEDFGAFTFRNLPVLKQANDDVIRQMKDQQLLPPLSIPPDSPSPLARTLGHGSKSKSRAGSVDLRGQANFQSPASSMSGPASPSASSSSSNPSRPTAPSSPYSLPSSHSRRPSEQHAAVDRLRSRQSSVTMAATAGDHARRNSLPSRLRTSSLSEQDRPKMSESFTGLRRTSAQTPGGSQLASPDEDSPDEYLSAPASIQPSTMSHPTIHQTHSAPPAVASVPPQASRSNTIDCLIAGRNPISNKVLETILVRLGCRCVVVPNGAEAILAAQGVRFDIIWMDIYMDIVDGEKAARMIKSTNNPSSSCPIIAVCSFGIGVDDDVGTLFSGTLPKPINRDQVLQVFRQKLSFNIERRRRSTNDEIVPGSTPV